MKRLITCVVLDILLLLEILRHFLGRLYSINYMKAEFARTSSNTMADLIKQQQTDALIEGIGVAAAAAILIMLITLISSEKRREENRPIVMNYNGPMGDVQNTYITPEYSGGSDHRVDPQNYGGKING